MASRKDYRIVARAVRTAYNCANDDKGVISQLAWDLADEFEEDNPNFNPLQFLAACGLDVSK